MEEKIPEEAQKPVEEKKEKKEVEKPPEKSAEEKKPEDSKESKEVTPPAPPEIVLNVYMHCEGCARKVRRCLKGFEGVEDVVTDCKSSKVVVKGEKADPLKVLERIHRKSHRRVQLISPIPKPPSEEEKKKAEEEKPKPEEKKQEPQVISVVLRVYMHCEGCAMKMKKGIQRMKGVESAEPDPKSSQVTVKGVFDPPKLVEYVFKKTGKHAAIVKQEPEKKEEEKGKEGKESKGEEGNKEKTGGGGEQEENKEKKGGGGGDGEGQKPEATVEETEAVELKKHEFYYYTPNYYPPNYYFQPNYYQPQPRHPTDMYAYPPQIFSDENPQIFSDENPNACSVM